MDGLEAQGSPPIPGTLGQAPQVNLGPEEDALRDDVEEHLQDHGRRKPKKRLADRYTRPGEDWETTYNASLASDLRKATSAYDDLL